MTYRERFKANRLMCLGLACMALRSILQTLLDRTGHSNNATDFALGALMGAGMALTLLFVWRNGRGRREPTTSTCAR